VGPEKKRGRSKASSSFFVWTPLRLIPEIKDRVPETGRPGAISTNET
jgi:hypothetical protein